MAEEEQKRTAGKGSGRKFWWLGGVFLMVLLGLLAVMPLVISFGLQQWLSEQGADEVRIEDVDFNPFLGTSAIRGLDVIRQNNLVLSVPELKLKISWRALLSRQLHVDSLTLTGIKLVIEQTESGSYRIGGIELPGATDSNVGDWDFGIVDFDLINSQVTFHSPGLRVDTRINSLELNHLATWADSPAMFKFSGSINNAIVRVDGKLQPLGDAPGFSGRISVQDFRDALDTPSYKIKKGRVEWTGRIDLGEQLAARGSLSLDDFQVISANDLPLLEFRKLESGNMVIKGLDSVVVENIQLTGTVIAKSPSTVADESRQKSDAMVTVDSIDINSLELTGGNRLSVDRIDLGGVQVRLEKGADGGWHHDAWLAALKQDDVDPVEEAVNTPEESIQEESPQEEPFQVKINTIEVIGDSAITFHDLSTDPVFKTTLLVERLSLGQLDSSKPQQASPLQMTGSINRHSKLYINGEFRPFLDAIDLNFDVVLKGLELPPLSSYTVTTIGNRLESGQLDAESTIKINNGKLDGSNQLVLRSLVLASVDNASREQLESQLALPVDTALNMLRDKHDVIRLDLPVSGDLDNPDFDISDAVNQAVGRAMKKGALTYLTLALQPYGALITIAKIAGEAASNVKLDPVIFAPGQSTLDESTHAYLDKVAGILNDRPELNMRLCGVSVKEDRLVLLEQLLAEKSKIDTGKEITTPRTIEEMLQLAAQAESEITAEQLLNLADERDNNVKQFLVSQHEVDVSRLIACQQTVDPDAAAKPRVDLLL